MDSLKDKFRRFMVGRYGTDELNQFLSILILVFFVINIITRSRIFYGLEALCLLLIYIRMFSKNTSKRFQENQKYLHYRFYVEESMKKLRFQLQQGRKYKIFRCPGCGQKIRIPRGHGKIQIHCRACGNDFMGKS